MKASQVNKWNASQCSTELLEEALAQTTSKAKRQVIQAELDSRKACGATGPMSLEDWLG